MYVNSGARTLYYAARADDDMATAEVLVPGGTDVLLKMQGDTGGAAVAPVRFVAWEGVTFAYAGWLEPNTQKVGYVDMQSAFRVLPGTTGELSAWGVASMGHGGLDEGLGGWRVCRSPTHKPRIASGDRAALPTARSPD